MKEEERGLIARGSPYVRPVRGLSGKERFGIWATICLAFSFTWERKLLGIELFCLSGGRFVKHKHRLGKRDEVLSTLVPQVL